MLTIMQRLGAMHTNSRPCVTNDNPYVESAFRTLRYRLQLPAKPFENLLAARCWVTDLTHWYNSEYRHPLSDTGAAPWQPGPGPV